MRTLIFCTAHAPTTLIWQRRYRRWVDAIKQSKLGHSQILLIDDGSPTLPGWADTELITINKPQDAAAIRSNAPVLLLRYPDRLGRKAIYDFPGWYRSFATGAAYANANAFEKLLHIESDAYIISDRMRDWLVATDNGWHTPWSHKYGFAEIAIQLIGKDRLATCRTFTSQPYENLIGTNHERMLPSTETQKHFVGDRYGEQEMPVPADADFCTQIPCQREPSYYWWLTVPPGRAQSHTTSELRTLTYNFGRNENGAPLLQDGWARPEPAGTWMVNAGSIMTLPPLPPAAAFDLVMNVSPYVGPTESLLQRLLVQVNATPVAEFDLTSTAIIGCEIPAAILRRDGTDKLRFIHPDAASPSLHGSPDKRLLSVQLRHLSLVPH